MKKILLTQDEFAFVDDEDYQDLMRFKWYACRGGKTFYAFRNIRINKRQSKERMHRRIMGLRRGDGKLTDHIDMNGLNNQRNNLRVATKAENQRNRKKPCNNTSGFKGVGWYKPSKKWVARIKVNSQSKNLGYFKSKIAAARAYNIAAREYFGEFAKLNLIEGDPIN